MSTPIGCVPFREEARAYLDGETTAGDRARFEEHLAGCAACRDDLASMVEVLGGLDQALGGAVDSVAPAVLRRIRGETPSTTAGARAESDAGGERATPSPGGRPEPRHVSLPSSLSDRPMPDRGAMRSLEGLAARGDPMPKLQACPKCGAQFDVSAFAAGQKFTCGACGTVVTAGVVTAGAPAHSGASRVPAGSAAPSRAVPAPAKGGRGPQYVPPERHAAAAQAASSRGGSEPRRERDRHERGPKKSGMSPAVMAGIGAAVLVIAVGALFMMKKGGDGGDAKKNEVAGGGPKSTPTPTPAAGGIGSGIVKPDPAGGMGEPSSGSGSGGGMSGGSTPTPSGESLDTIESEWKSKAHHPGDEMKAFFDRYKALGSRGEERAKTMAALILKEVDPNWKPAHELLQHKEFAHEVPEMISFRQYPYIKAVEEASAQRWFDDEEAYAIANKAWEKTEAHAKRLESDSTFRALDGARQLIARDKNFKDYNYEAIFASPYLICYSSEERLAEEDFMKMTKKERAEKLRDLEKSREKFRRVLAEKAKIYQQLYTEFLKRYGEACDLHDLMGPFGGRPDLPQGKRSYRDGCPMIIWIFSDKKAFNDYHEVVAKERVDPNIAGYFSPLTGWVYLYDGDDREFEINKNVHEGTHQLEHWFQKQKREWGHPVVPQSFFGEGFAEFMGSVAMSKDRTLSFHGVNRPRIEFLKNMKSKTASEGKPPLVFPLKELVSFEGYGSVHTWPGAQGWSIPPIFPFYAQSWALVYYLNDFQDHKYKAKFTKFLDDMLNHPDPSKATAEHYAFERFKRNFDIKSEDDWKKMDKEFREFYAKLMDMDAAKIAPEPPSKDDWPGYVPIEPTNPLGETQGGGDAKKEDK